jgi:hypothetical protein
MQDLKSIALAGIPLAAMFFLPKVFPRVALRIRPYAAIEKVKTIDKLSAAVTVKNSGEVDLTGLRITLGARGPKPNYTYTLSIHEWTDVSLTKGQQLRFPTTGDEFSAIIPADAPTGSWEAVAAVLDSAGNVLAHSELEDAWTVREPIKRVEIVSIEVD